jgi:hypothetical protein
MRLPVSYLDVHFGQQGAVFFSSEKGLLQPDMQKGLARFTHSRGQHFILWLLLNNDWPRFEFFGED